MTILQEIQKWSEELADWQQHAIAKLYAREEIVGPVFEHVYALAKGAHGLVDPEGRKPDRLAPAQVAAAQPAGQSVKLLSIGELKNVNALATGQMLPVAKAGLTIVYGGNGAGKSGYSRVLKKACRARDQSEPILPDARKPKNNGAVAEAVFGVEIDGAASALPWAANKAAPPALSSIAIFDSLCARAYVDNQNDFAYVPYGLDILEGLVKVAQAVRDRATAEQQATRPDLTPYAALSATPTKAGALVKTLSEKTLAGDVEKLATLTAEDVAKAAELRAALAEADPKVKATGLKAQASRLEALGMRITAAFSVVDQDKVDSLKGLVQTSNTAKEAANLAAAAFNARPGQLNGTGSEPWRDLLRYAGEFSVTCHDGRHLAELGPEDACPLCQNLLGEAGAERFSAFTEFVEAKAQKAAKDAKEAAANAYTNIRDGQIGIGLDQGLRIELDAIDPAITLACDAFQASLVARRDDIVKAASSTKEWAEIGASTANPAALIEAERVRFAAVAKALEESADPAARAKQMLELAELEARRALAEVKEPILVAIQKFGVCAKLAACATATQSAPITKKATDLARAMATPQVVDALNKELAALDVHELSVVMRNQGQLGKAQFKLLLESPSGALAGAVLSEGEQRAIAIASFLAEVGLAAGDGGIVFDDPVSSLDHDRRRLVAKRLAAEATKRQVLIFTHDVFFLGLLQLEAETAGALAATQSVRRTAAGFGVFTERVPFDKMKTKDRIGALRQMHVDATRARNDGDVDEFERLSRTAYFSLRLAWERAVEEILFNDVIARFDVGVQTQKLRAACIDDDDYKRVDAGMTKASTYAHDGAAAAQVAVPPPAELKVDIEDFATWVGEARKRGQDADARRKA